MTRPERAFGRPGTPVLPEHWAADGDRAVTTRRNSLVTLRRPGAQSEEWDDDLGRTVEVPFDPYAEHIAATIHALGGDEESGPSTETAGARVRVTAYVVSIALDALEGDMEGAFVEGTLVEVESCTDPLLVGRTLHTNDVVRGEDRFSRDLIVTTND